MPYYGQNGFYLPFKNNASVTALGLDYSGDATRYNATAVGNAQISTAQSKWGGSSAYFDGTGDYLTLTNKEYLGADDFTVELWARPAANSYVNIVNINGNSTNYAALRFSFINDVTNPVLGLAMSNNGTAFQVNATISTSHTLNTWAHYAICKSGSTVKVYKDGTEISSQTITGTLMTGDRTWIGAIAAGQNYNGYIDDLRVYRGVCKYTANFTAPSAALPMGSSDPNWQYTQIAMPMDGTNASTTFPIYFANSWTPNNFSVTAGVGNDSMIDVPTRYGDGSNNRGNYCTLNSVANLRNDNAALGSIKNGNLTLDYTGTPGTNSYSAIGTFVIKGGKWYWEGTLSSAGTSSRDQIGLMLNTNNFTNGNLSHLFLDTSEAGNYGYTGAGSTLSKASSPATYSSYGAAFTVNDIIGVAFDSDAGSITFYKNGVSQGVAFTGLTDSRGYYPAFGRSSDWEVNFGQRPFSYTPPSGFKALNTFNLP